MILIRDSVDQDEGVDVMQDAVHMHCTSVYEIDRNTEADALCGCIIYKNCDTLCRTKNIYRVLRSVHFGDSIGRSVRSYLLSNVGVVRTIFIAIRLAIGC